MKQVLSIAMSEFNIIQKYFTKPSPQADLGVGDDAALVKVAEGMQLAISSDMLVAGTHFFHDAAAYDIGWKALAVNVSDMAAMGAQARWATLAIALPNIAAPSPTGGEWVLSAAVSVHSPSTSRFEDSTNTATQDSMNADEISSAAPVTPSPLMGEARDWCSGEGEAPPFRAITEHWLAEFSRGFFACADAFHVDLIGGDTTKGPLNISVTIMGEVPIGAALRRDGAKVDDDVWVSGQLGSAALGLAHLQGKIKLQNELETCLKALNTPTPRTALGLALRGIATSCIDVSDGLLADLGHILKASNCGASIDLEKIPCIDLLKNNLDNPQFQAYMLAGGDDYELCFTAPKAKHEQLNTLSKQLNLAMTCIGSTRMAIGLQANYQNKPITLLKHGFDHFT
jgi:thiamine-monophosphate kinase